MARVLSTAIVLALLAATAAAFALTERAKLELSPIYGTQQGQIFSPDSKVVRQRLARIHFRVRHGERIDVWVQTSGGRKVADLLTGRSVRPRQRVVLVWDGFEANGLTAPDGAYRAVVKLRVSHRTIVVPSDIRLDTKPPRVTVHLKTKYPIISPDGDGHADYLRVPYTVNEPAHAILLLRGKLITFTRSQKPTGELTWFGKAPRTGKPLPPGRYVLGIAAQDEAGNRSKGYPFAIVQIRYVTLARSRVVVRPGARFAIRVSTDAPRVQWQLRARSGTLPRGTLRIRAPKHAGVYHLYVTVRDHSAACTVVVA